LKRIRSFGFWAFTPNSSALCPKQNKQNLILFLAKLQSSAEDCNDVEKGEKDINPPNPLYTKGAEKKFLNLPTGRQAPFTKEAEKKVPLA